MNIVVLSASTNESSNSDYLADRFIEGMQNGTSVSDVQMSKLRLKDLSINHFHVSYYEPQADQGEDFRRVQSLMEAAHGFVIATPVWNFSVPAHLKNLIDRMGSFALNETRSLGTLKGKPFYLIFTGGVPMPGWTVLQRKTTSHLPESLQYFGASFIGQHFEPKCMKRRGVFGLVVDQRPDSIALVRRKGFNFAKVVAEYERTGKAPLRYRTRAKVMKWGEKILKKIA